MKSQPIHMKTTEYHARRETELIDAINDEIGDRPTLTKAEYDEAMDELCFVQMCLVHI